MLGSLTNYLPILSSGSQTLMMAVVVAHVSTVEYNRAVALG